MFSLPSPASGLDQRTGAVAEANAIQPLLANSPWLRWLYAFTDVRGASRLTGTAEIVVALLVAARPFVPRLSALGSCGAVAMFATTLSDALGTIGSRPITLKVGSPTP